MEKKSQSAVIKKVLHYIRRYIPLLVLSVIFAAATVVLTLYFPILTGRAIDLILEEGKVDFSRMILILRTAGIVVLLTAIAQWLMNIRIFPAMRRRWEAFWDILSRS